jgi:hypothetical protein
MKPIVGDRPPIEDFMFRLALRTLPVFAVIIGFATFLAAYMNFSGVRSAYLDLIRSRMAMVAQEVGGDISAALALGIGLGEQATLPRLLVLQASTDPRMKSIDVVAEDGAVLFSSDAARVGVPDEAGADPGTFRYQQRIVNDFEVPLGTVVMRLDRTAMDAEVEGLRMEILWGAVPAALGAILAGCLACLGLLTHLHRRARHSAEGRTGDDPISRAAAEMNGLGPEARA